MSDWGLENRLSRIIQEDGRTLVLAVDHGYFLGAVSGLEDPKQMLADIAPYADAVMLTRGMLTSSVDYAINKPIILRADGGPSIEGDKSGVNSLANHEITLTLEDALRLNASAVAISIFVGTEYETQTMNNLSRMVSEADRYGMPVLAVVAVGTQLQDLKEDSRYLGLACRMAAEHGAHIVKTYYSGEGFESITEGCLAPVVMAGGKAEDGVKVALEQTHNALQKGAVGVDMGRNIFQADNPVSMIKAVRSVVHEGKDVDEAYELYQSFNE